MEVEKCCGNTTAGFHALVLCLYRVIQTRSLTNQHAYFIELFSKRVLFMIVAKQELYSHLERGLGRNMTARCSNSQTQVICDAQRDMAG